MLIIHFGWTYFYTAPPEFNCEKLQHVSNHYMQPFFHQNWALFAPDPPDRNITVEVRVDSSSTWRNITRELLNDHNKWRVTYHGRIAMAFGNAALYATSDPGQSDLLRQHCRNYLRLDDEQSIQIKLTETWLEGDEKDGNIKTYFL